MKKRISNTVGLFSVPDKCIGGMLDFRQSREMWLPSRTGQEKVGGGKKVLHLLFDPGWAGGWREECWKNKTEERKVAEDGIQSTRESCSSFCLPKVYPVVYTPRRAAAPRAEGPHCGAKWICDISVCFSERGNDGLEASSRTITHMPTFGVHMIS